MAPQLFADRFVVLQSDEAIDLATGESVWIRPVALGDRLGQADWLMRCAALSGLSHPHLVALVDFGAVGRAGHFEAWACPAAHPGWKVRDEGTAIAVSDVVSFLMSRSLSPGRLRWPSVIDVAGRPALLPTDETGVPLGADDEAGLEHCAAQLERLLASCPDIKRRRAAVRPDDVPVHRAFGVTGDETIELVERLADVLDGGVSGQPRVIRFGVRKGPTDVPLLRALARGARLHGYIPITSAILDVGGHAAPHLGQWLEAIDGRHVLLFQTGNKSGCAKGAALFFLSLGLSSDRPHVMLRLEVASKAGSTAPSAVHEVHSRPLAVREESARYLTAPGDSPPALEAASGAAPIPVPAWSPGLSNAPCYLDTPPRTIAEVAANGHHAQAERLLREALGRCARRHDEAAAGETALALGRLLLIRGQLAEASRMLERARQHFDHARLADAAIQAAVFVGLAWTDGGRLREAEAALRSSRIAAAQMPAPVLHEFATLALARCLFWQERVAEAWDCLERSRDATPEAADPDADDVAREWIRLGEARRARERLHAAPPGGASLDVLPSSWPVGAIRLGVARACLSARVALAAGDLARAGRFGADARDRAGEAGDPTELSAACYAKAAVFGVLGDISVVRELVEEGIDASRRAHAPLRALRLRVVLAQGLQRAGREREARALVARLARLDPARLPRVVGLPLERVIRGEGRHHTSQVGVGLIPAGNPAGGSLPAAAAMPARAAIVETVVDVLGVCQSSDDEAAVLQRVTAILRERVRAASVACFGGDQDLTFVLAADGSEHRVDAVARRAIEAGVVIAPTSTASGLEAAVPIRFAGACVGAYGCRWAADVPPDWAVAGAVLAAASAAVAPCVRTALDRRATPAEPVQMAAGEIVGVSEPIASLRREILQAARAPFNVVIEGESGSGKELVARAVHRLGPRKHRPLCALNCAALTDDLVEAELFGHARGAFTGAVAERKGLFEEADHGILVLDEVGELSARAQAKLLRAIQEGEVRRVGENFSRSVDVRIVAATNRPLRPAVEAGVFRRDLLYRLEVIRILVPPLRARLEDIPVLASHFWREATARVESRCTLAPATLAALARYDWPGNVRELQNVMAALAVAVGRRGSVGPEHLPGIIAGQVAATTVQNLEDARRMFEARFVRAALARAGGRRAQAAGDLGLTRQGLAKLMARLGIG